jgi:hypothetical protein
MTEPSADRSERLRVASVVILIVGFLAAVVVYATASQAPPNPLGDPEDSKAYLRQMQLYGGQANVIAYEVRQWFAGLWHGKPLAFTVAGIAVLLAAGCRFAAVPLPSLEEGEEGDEDEEGGAGGPGAAGHGSGTPTAGA